MELLTKIDKQFGPDRMMQPGGLSEEEAYELNRLLDKLRNKN